MDLGSDIRMGAMYSVQAAKREIPDNSVSMANHVVENASIPIKRSKCLLGPVDEYGRLDYTSSANRQFAQVGERIQSKKNNRQE